MSTGCIRDAANVVLLTIMAGAAYSHYALHDDTEKMMPAAVCGALLLLRLIARKLVCSCDMTCHRKSTPAGSESHTKSE